MPFFYFADLIRSRSAKDCRVNLSAFLIVLLSISLFDFQQPQLITSIIQYNISMKIAFLLLFIFQSLSINPICRICHDVVKLIQQSVPSGPSQKFADQIAIIYCTKAHLQDHTVCKGAVRQMVKVIIPSLWKHYTDPHLICSEIRLCGKQYIKRNLADDINNILAGKPTKQWENPTLSKKLKVMHISDLHIDLFYTTGAPSKCQQPVCCRTNTSLNMDPWKILRNHNAGIQLVDQSTNDQPAGYWGSLNDCDLPMQTFHLFLKEIQKMDLDLIIWTGDNTPHDIWKQSQSYNLNFTIIISQLLRQHTKAIVIPVMGNHESYPVNVYDYEGDRESMLNGGLAEAWKPWLTQQAYDMLLKKGYFSIVLPQFNNLKILSVNTQAQNDQNFILLQNPTDPGHMLKWIENQLKDSQSKNQYVYIIGHIPPQDALNEWAMRFNALTDRYSFIIRGQFYGHTHKDQVGFFFSCNNKSSLTNYYLIAPSLQCGRHPQYRVMDVDYDTLQVVDYQQYRLDLNKFNKKQDKAKFELFYTFKEAYGLKDMTVKGGMADFNQKLKKEAETQIKYSYFRSSGVEAGKSGPEVYCDTMASPSLRAQCQGIVYKKSFFDKMAGNWKDLKHHS